MAHLARSPCCRLTLHSPAAVVCSLAPDWLSVAGTGRAAKKGYFRIRAFGGVFGFGLVLPHLSSCGPVTLSTVVYRVCRGAEVPRRAESVQIGVFGASNSQKNSKGRLRPAQPPGESRELRPRPRKKCHRSVIAFRGPQSSDSKILTPSWTHIPVSAAVGAPTHCLRCLLVRGVNRSVPADRAGPRAQNLLILLLRRVFTALPSYVSVTYLEQVTYVT